MIDEEIGLIFMKKVMACLFSIIAVCVIFTACSGMFGIGYGNKASVSLEIGDYILIGKYYDEPILWRYVADDENGMLMLSDKILCRKLFDASGQNGSHSRRQTYSSNYWADSNIRSWLNSSAPAGEVIWLCGNPPVPSLEYWYRYDNEKGFLADGNFTATERNAIKEVTQKSLLDPIDADFAIGGSSDSWQEIMSRYDESFDIQDFVENQYDKICYEYISDRVFLLDIKQLWDISQNRSVLGDKHYLTTLTQKAIDDDAFEQYMRNEYGHGSCLTADDVSGYCLRTPYGLAHLSRKFG